jgi:hypothetical protein
MSFPALKIANANANVRPREDSKYHQMKMGILKILINHYDTLVSPLVTGKISSKDRHNVIRSLTKTFTGMTGKDEHRKKLVADILDTMPLFEGKDVLMRWRRMDFVDSRWVSSVVENGLHEWVFTQIAVENGLPKYIFTPLDGPIPDAAFEAAAAAAAADDTVVAPRTRTVHLVQEPVMKLPTKWNRGSFVNMRVVGPPLSLPNFIKWLQEERHLRISHKDVQIVKEKNIIAYLQDRAAFTTKLATDPSLATFFKTHLLPDRKLKKDSEIIELLFGAIGDDRITRQQKVQNMFALHSNEFKQSDFDWEAISRLFDMSVFMIRSRADYAQKRGDAAATAAVKRGDDNDRLVSTTIFSSRENYKNKPIICIYKCNLAQDAYSEYKIISYSDSLLIPSISHLPVDIQKFIEKVGAGAT